MGKTQSQYAMWWALSVVAGFLLGLAEERPGTMAEFLEVVYDTAKIGGSSLVAIIGASRLAAVTGPDRTRK